MARPSCRVLTGYGHLWLQDPILWSNLQQSLWLDDAIIWPTLSLAKQENFCHFAPICPCKCTATRRAAHSLAIQAEARNQASKCNGEGKIGHKSHTRQRYSDTKKASTISKLATPRDMYAIIMWVEALPQAVRWIWQIICHGSTKHAAPFGRKPPVFVWMCLSSESLQVLCQGPSCCCPLYPGALVQSLVCLNFFLAGRNRKTEGQKEIGILLQYIYISEEFWSQRPFGSPRQSTK